MKFKLLLYLYALLGSFGLSFLFVGWARKVALAKNIVAHPSPDRFHDKKIPMLGGVGIVCSFYLCILFHFALFQLFPEIHSMLPESLIPYSEGVMKTFPRIIVILSCGLLIFVLGLLDDLTKLGPKRKFLFEIMIGVILYYNNIRITLFLGDGLPSLIITVFWVVAITNAFNLLDNIDGLSSGIAVISSFILFLLCVQGGQLLVSLLLLIFIGSLLGFLKYNYPPASVFMGDAGSLFIGYIMSVFTIMSTFYYDKTISIVPIVSPLLILSVPIYDTLSVILIRIKERKSIFKGDTNHFSHRLLRLGMNKRDTICLIYLISLCLGMAALTLNTADLRSQVILLLQATGLLSIIYLLESSRYKNNGKREEV